MRIRGSFTGGILIMAGVAMLAVAGCSKKTKQESAEQPAAQSAMPEGHPAVGAPTPDMARLAHANIKADKKVVLPDEVKAKWNKVKMEISDASSKSSEVMTLKVGNTVPLKKDGLKLKVDAFVPDYRIVEDRIETRSNEPKNPAVFVELFDGDKLVAKGWVFKDFPEFNSFNNDRIHLTLVSPGLGKPDSKK